MWFVHQPCNAETDHLSPLLLHPDFVFDGIDILGGCQYSQDVSRASPFQTVICTVVGETITRISFALDTSFLRHTSTSCPLMGPKGVAGIQVRVLLCTIVHSHAGNFTGFPFETLAFFFPLVNRYLFLLQRHLIPLRLLNHCSCLDFPVPGVQSSVIVVYDLYSFFTIVPSIFDNLGIDNLLMNFNVVTNPNTGFWVPRTHVFLNLYKLSQDIVRWDFSSMDNTIPSSFSKTNSWISSLQRNICK